MSLDAIRCELETATSTPEKALRRAVEHAAELAPSVIELINKVCEGVYLLPKQERLLFYGLYALAAARETTVYRPLMRLLQCDFEDLDRLLGDAVTESLPQIVLAVFDGTIEPLIEAIEDRGADGSVRWGLFDALARLTFDGRVPRETTLGLIDRFDRERLAAADDPAWEGFQDIVMYLGLDNRADLVRASWEDGRCPQRAVDREDWEQQLARTRADPASDAPFGEAGLVPLTDPVEALAWAEPRERPATPLAADEERPMREDPAATIALNQDEIEWFAGFLECRQVPATTMTLEELDGFFTALIVGPEVVLPSAYLPEVWGRDTEDGPTFDSLEQAEFVMGLMMRHWNTIATRLAERYPHLPELGNALEDDEGRDWAHGFMRGVAHCWEAWQPLVDDRESRGLLGPVILLETDDPEITDEAATPEDRWKVIESLPLAILGLHLYWREREEDQPAVRPLRRQKIGRNQLCPCGSGRKYKNCCHSSTAPLPPSFLH